VLCVLTPLLVVILCVLVVLLLRKATRPSPEAIAEENARALQDVRTTMQMLADDWPITTATTPTTTLRSSTAATPSSYSSFCATPNTCTARERTSTRAKPKCAQDGGQVKDYGYDMADAERGMEYVLDLVVEMHKDELPPGTPLTSENFRALVVKTSGPAENNPLPRYPVPVPDPPPSLLRGTTGRRHGRRPLQHRNRRRHLQHRQDPCRRRRRRPPAALQEQVPHWQEQTDD
jgi:hypothetical protein